MTDYYLGRTKAESSRKTDPILCPRRGRGAREEWPVVSECDEMELAVILMPVLPMGPSRPWLSLGGMLAFSRAWSAPEVMPAKDTPRIV